MKKLFLLLLIATSINTQAQNIGINNTNPQAALDVQGDLRLRSAILTLPSGLNNDVDLTTIKSSVYMFGGGALTINACQITGFTGGVDGRIVTIFNNSTLGAIQLYDANFSVSPSAAANKIITGTGNNVVIFGNGSATLRYDGAKQKWTVMSSNYTAGLDPNPSPWNTLGNNIFNANSGNIGIGTGATNPVNKLQIGSTPTFSANDIAIGNGTQQMGLTQTATASTWYSNTNFALLPAGGTGNVGIGDAAPTEKLHVFGNGKIGNDVWATAADDRVLKFGDGNFVSIGEVGADDMMQVKGSNITLKTGNTGKVLIPDSKVGIGNVGSAVNNKLQIGNAPGFLANDIAIGNGTQGMSIAQSPTASTFYTNTNFAFLPAGGAGNVGVGTSTPAAKLDVEGSMRVSEDASGLGTIFKQIQAGNKIIGSSNNYTGNFACGSDPLGNTLYCYYWRINFPNPFSNPPHVVVTPREQTGVLLPDKFAAYISTVTNTYVDIRITRLDGTSSSWAQQLQLDWIAFSY
jgi:H-type lectin domain